MRKKAVPGQSVRDVPGLYPPNNPTPYTRSFLPRKGGNFSVPWSRRFPCEPNLHRSFCAKFASYAFIGVVRAGKDFPAISTRTA